MTPEQTSHGFELRPTIVCSWCKQVVQTGAPKISHGICRPCVGTFFGRKAPGPIAGSA